MFHGPFHGGHLLSPLLPFVGSPWSHFTVSHCFTLVLWYSQWEQPDRLPRSCFYIIPCFCFLWLFHTDFLLGLFLDSDIDGGYSSEIVVDLQWTTHHYTPEYRILPNPYCENLRSHIPYYNLVIIYSKKCHQSAWKHNLLFKCIYNPMFSQATCFFTWCLRHISTPKIAVTCSSKMLIDFSRPRGSIFQKIKLFSNREC
jgi:hypothetical protein